MIAGPRYQIEDDVEGRFARPRATTPAPAPASAVTPQTAVQQAIQQGLGQTLQAYFDEGGPQVGGNTITVGNHQVTPTGQVDASGNPVLTGFNVTTSGMATIDKSGAPHASQDTYTYDASGKSTGVQRNVDLGGANHLVLTYDAGGQLTNQSSYNDSGGGLSGLFQAALPVLGAFLIPGLGGEIAAILSDALEITVSDTVGKALARVAVDVAQGKDFDAAVRDAAISTVVQTGAMDSAKQLKSVIDDPAVRNMVVSAGASAAQSAATGGSVQDIIKNAGAGAAGALTAAETGSRPFGGAVTTGLATGSLLGAAAGAAGQLGAGYPLTAPPDLRGFTADELQRAAQTPSDAGVAAVTAPEAPAAGAGVGGRGIEQVPVTGAAAGAEPFVPTTTPTRGVTPSDITRQTVPVTGAKETAPFVAEPVGVTGARDYAAEPVKVTGKKDFTAEPVSITGQKPYTAEPVSITGTREYVAEPVTITDQRPYIAEPVDITAKAQPAITPTPGAAGAEPTTEPDTGIFISSYLSPRTRTPVSTITPSLFRSPLEQALSAYTPPGEIEDPSTGKTRRDVWNEASLRLKDALGL